jgi:intracellular sulfur oxidation DsrE/DsrF family protein
MDTETWDDITLTAYIDGELDDATHNAVLGAMEHDKALSEHVCRLRRTKDWMHAGYGSATPPQRELPGRRTPWHILRSGVAASVMALAIGVGGGLLGYMLAERGTTTLAENADPHRVVLHIDDSDPRHFGQLLDYTENFLQEHRDSGVQVEVVANAGGLDFLRVDGSSYQQRVKTLTENYTNVQFIACMNAIRNLEATGIDATLIDDVHTGETAVDHIVKRLNQGWTYRKVESLSDI